MKKIITVILIQIFFVSLLVSADERGSISDKYMSSLNFWINADINLQQMLREISDIEADISQQSLGWESYNWRARISLLRGQIYYELNENKLSTTELENCLYYAGQANELRVMSETLSTMAMANSLLMLQKGFLFMISNYSIASEQAAQALELDENNSHAALIQAQFLCNAPSIAGGDLDKGIAMLISLSERSDLNVVDRFYILKSLAEVYRDNNRKTDASLICRKALDIFPGNIFCGDMLVELEK